MNKDALVNALSGGDLRSNQGSRLVAARIKSNRSFDVLLPLLFHSNRLVVMRTADAIETVTQAHPEYLDSHRDKELGLLQHTTHIELIPQCTYS